MPAFFMADLLQRIAIVCFSKNTNGRHHVQTHRAAHMDVRRFPSRRAASPLRMRRI
jgi:hypothetical protein